MMKNMLRVLLVGAFFTAFPLCAYADDTGTTTVRVNPQRWVQLPSDPDGAIRHAREQVATGDLQAAIKDLARYVAAHPDEAMPARLLGDLYYRSGDLHKAEFTYQSILRQYPRDKETHNRLGSVFATESRIDDAIDEFNRSLPGTDSVPDLVRLHEIKGDLAQYERDKIRYAADYPTDPEAQLEVAKLYQTTHRPADAVAAYRRALDNAPDDLIAWNGLGTAYMDLHDYGHAVDYLKRCMGRDPQSYPCSDNLGAAYLEMRAWELADKELTRAHRLEPEKPEAIVNFGYLADARGDWKKAVAFYLAALAVSPYSTDAYIDLGVTYEQHKQYQLAQSVLLKGLAVSPNEGRLHMILGQTYVDQGQNALARTQFEAAAKSDDPVVRALAQQRVATSKPQ
jgi:tetratricopeptide (TPR) repeat protein